MEKLSERLHRTGNAVIYENATKAKTINAGRAMLEMEVAARRLEEIAELAVASIQNAAWQGVCDEDVALERALVRYGLIESDA